MRVYIWSFLVLSLFSCNNSTVMERFPDGTTKEKCELINGKRDGICIRYFSDGNIKSECNYENDVLNGISKFYHHNGSINWVTNFSNGIKNGQIDYYDSIGRKFLTSNFKNGELDGLCTSYFDNGSVKERMTYKKGKLDGIFESFYQNKNLEMRVKYINGYRDDFVVYDSLGKEIDHLIKYDIQFNPKNNEFNIKILNPLYNLMALKLVDKQGEGIKEEIFSLDYHVKYRTSRDTLKGYLLDIDTLTGESGVVKCSIYFEYPINRSIVPSGQNQFGI